MQGAAVADDGTPPDPAPLRDERRRAETARFFTVSGLLLLSSAIVAQLTGTMDDWVTGPMFAIPLILLALLARLGVRREWALALAVLGAAGLLILLVGALVVFAFMVASAGDPEIGFSAITRAEWRTVFWSALWCAGALAAAVVTALPPVRRRFAGAVPVFDAGSPLHAIALSLTAAATIMFLGQLAASGGHPPIITAFKRDESLRQALLEGNLAASMIYSMIWAVPAAILAAGFPQSRSLGEALRRLGVVLPTVRQVIFALALAGVLVGAFWLVEDGIALVWKSLGWPQTDMEAFEDLFRPLINPAGAAVIGVTAGVEEEILIRGVLQPRLGLLLPNLFFTSLHAMQYGFDGLLSVFLAGLVLGIVRNRTNTTTAAILHGTYDFILVMISYATHSPG